MNPEAEIATLNWQVILLTIYAIGVMVGFALSGFTGRFGYVANHPEDAPLPELGIFLWPVVLPIYGPYKMGAILRSRSR